MTSWIAYICDTCGRETDHLPWDAPVPDDWYCRPDADEHGDLILCPTCKPTEEAENG